MPGLADLLALARGYEPEPEREQTGYSPPDFRALDTLLSARPQTAAPRRSRPTDVQPNARGDVQQMAQQLAASRYGWTGPEWQALQALWQRESGWNPGAVNESSGAAGIPQMLPSAHPDINVQSFLTDPRQQVLWGLRYIAGRYGSPTAALAHSDASRWY